MRRLIFRIRSAFYFGSWAFMNPDTVTISNFTMLSDLLIMIFKVAEERRHMMTNIACIHPDTGKDHDIVTIWAGSGIGADPIKRISELIKENDILKNELSKAVINN